MFLFANLLQRLLLLSRELRLRPNAWHDLVGVEGRLVHAVAPVGDEADDTDEDQRDEHEDPACQHHNRSFRLAHSRVNPADNNETLDDVASAESVTGSPAVDAVRQSGE